MKADARRLAPALGRLASLRVVCLYGDDTDLVHATARAFVVAAAGSPDDPFRVTVCDGEQRETIEHALASPPLSGGRAVIWIRHAGERLATIIQAVLDGPFGALLVLEYATAGTKSKLRVSVEQTEVGCVVACQTQPDAARAEIEATLAGYAVSVDREALRWLVEVAATPTGSAARVAELAALYAGQGGSLDLADAAAFTGSGADGAHAGLAAGLSRGLAGDREMLDRMVGVGLEESGAVTVLRAALSHLQRLRALARSVAAGRSLAEAGRDLRPPLFFRETADVAVALQAVAGEQWSAACHAVWEAERLSKNTGVPPDAMCRETLARLGRPRHARL